MEEEKQNRVVVNNIINVHSNNPSTEKKENTASNTNLKVAIIAALGVVLAALIGQIGSISSPRLSADPKPGYTHQLVTDPLKSETDEEEKFDRKPPNEPIVKKNIYTRGGGKRRPPILEADENIIIDDEIEKKIKSSIEELNDLIKHAAETHFEDKAEREFFLDRIEKRFELESTIEVSNINTGKVTPYPIRKYFIHLTHLKDYYSNVKFSFSNIKIIDFKKGENVKYKYFSRGQFSQVFRGYIDKDEVYNDVTVKISQIFLYNNGDVKFGNTKIVSTREIIKESQEIIKQ